MKNPFKIKTIHAFIAEDKDGQEGLVGMHTPDGWVPFVCADEDRINSIRPIAEKIAQQQEKTIKLIKFSLREEIEVIKP